MEIFITTDLTDETDEDGYHAARAERGTEGETANLRRQGGHLHFSEHKFVPRPDGISNAITTFDKDNYVLIEYDAPAAQVKSEKLNE